MTVKELIEELEDLPQDLEVVFYYTGKSVYGIDYVEFFKTEDGIIDKNEIALFVKKII